MEFLIIYARGGLIILALVTALWLFSLRLQNSSIIDIFWGIGFVILVWVYGSCSPDGYLPRKILISVLVTIWGLRLALTIYKRNIKRGEDFRYARWRSELKDSWWWQSYFKVFLLQGLLLWIISAPLLAAEWSSQPETFTGIDSIALAVWIIGFFFEAVGDWQLSRFQSDPQNRGRVLASGLWRYTRHPNYFGDAVQWWGYYLIAVAAGGIWTIFSPVLMTFLLVRVSGVQLLEKTLKDSKPDYHEYIARTSPFIPLPPRKVRNSKQ